MEIGQNALKSRACCKDLKSESICQSVYFRNTVARAGSKLHRPGIFPSLEKLLRAAWLWSLLVQGAWIANRDLISPQLLSTVRSCTSWSYSTAWQSSPTGFLTQGPQASKVVQVQQMMLLWVRFLHYKSRGPPWHPIQANVTSKEWYKRDLPFKAFLWYLTAVHQTHQSERASKNKAKHKKNPQTLSKVPVWQQSRAEESYSRSCWSSGCGAAETCLGSIWTC